MRFFKIALKSLVLYSEMLNSISHVIDNAWGHFRGQASREEMDELIPFVLEGDPSISLSIRVHSCPFVVHLHSMISRFS